MQIVGRKSPPVIVQVKHTGPIGLLARVHVDFLGQAIAFAQIARRAGSDHIFPRSTSAPGTRNEMVERQVVRAPAILAAKPVPQKHIEAGKSGVGAGPYIVTQGNHAGQLDFHAGTVHHHIISGNNIYPVKTNSLNRVLP